MPTPSSSTRNFTKLDSPFWSHFAKNIWEKKPLVVRKARAGLLKMGEAEIFHLLVLYSDRCRQLKNPTGFKFYIKGLQAYEEDVLQILPVKKDRSLLGYHERMRAMFSDYCLVCDELLKINVEKQGLLSEFTEELYRHVGFPNRFSEMGLYLGNYRKTPFGVHIDRCGVFSFPVSGTKKFRLWTSAFVKKNPRLDRAFEYAKYKKDSRLLTAGPGDMTYWPSSAWHIAESDGSFSATWSLGVWVDKAHHESFSQSLGGLLEDKLGSAGLSTLIPFKNLHETSGEVKLLPDAFTKSIQVLQSLTSAELQENFLKSWMVHISMQGFKNRPLPDFKLNLKSRIHLRSDRDPILWRQSVLSKTKILLCFGGVLVESKKSSGLLKLVKAINAGKTCVVSDYIGAAALPALRRLAGALI